MKILYIHGLQGYPQIEKLQLIENRGHIVHAKHFDFMNVGDQAFEVVENFAKDFSLDFIIGSSMGGYLGYWLGQKLDLPQLLFNPALPLQNILAPIPQGIQERKSLKSQVVLGAQDQMVPAELNLTFFKDRPQARVLVCQWLGHRIDLETFDEMLAWANL